MPRTTRSQRVRPEGDAGHRATRTGLFALSHARRGAPEAPGASSRRARGYAVALLACVLAASGVGLLAVGPRIPSVRAMSVEVPTYPHARVARPQAPTSALFRGTAAYYGVDAPVGMTVAAWVGNTAVVTSTVFLSNTQSTYQLLVPGDDPETLGKEGPAEGEAIRFRVGGVTANEADLFHDGETRTLNLHVTKLEVCLAAFHDLNRDGTLEPAEPLISGVEINVLQFLIVRQYTTTGDVDTEPSCALHDPTDTSVRAVDWPLAYQPLNGPAQPIEAITDTQGAYTVAFPFVPFVTETPGPTPTPTKTLGPGPSSTPTATGPTPTQTHTATATSTQDAATPTGTQSGATATNTTQPTATTSTPQPTATTATPQPTATGGTPAATHTPVPADVAIIVVNSTDDPGTVGDLFITLDEAIRLATGRLSTSALSIAEKQQILGEPGADSHDLIRFDTTVFPVQGGGTITIQPPTPEPPLVLARPNQDLSAIDRNSGLPELSTGGDVIDGSTAGVALEGGIGADPFDGIVISSDDNAVYGLRLSNFNAGLVVTGEAQRNALGGAGAGHGNLLVNNIAGLVVTGPGARETTVLGSRIGVDENGDPAGNATYGILITGGASGNRVGSGDGPNVISANFLDGVAVLGSGSGDNVVAGNLIGTNLSGTEAIPNGTGVVVGSGAENTVVGGLGVGDGNVISGNVAEGVWIQSAGTRGTKLQGNIIGLSQNQTTALGNGGAGVLVSDGATSSQIGGPAAAAGNRIFYNGDAGVRIRGATSVRHMIRRNPISMNAAGGIVLENGANEAIMAPILTNVTATSIDGVAPPGSLVEVFSDAAGQGAHIEGTTVADAAGAWHFDAAGTLTGPQLHATATDSSGNTSEFGSEGEVPPTPTASATPTEGPSPTPVGDNMLFLPATYKHEALFMSLDLVPEFSSVAMGAIQPIELRVSAAKHLYGAQIEMTFDPVRLEVIDEEPGVPGVQILPGDFPSPAQKFKAENLADNAAGTIRYAFTLVGDDELNGDGLMATIRVRAKAPGRATLGFDELMLSDPMALPIRARGHGAIVDIGMPPTGTPPTPTVAPPTAPPPTQPPPTQPPATVPPTGPPPTQPPPTQPPPTVPPGSPSPTPLPTHTSTAGPPPTHTPTVGPGTPTNTPVPATDTPEPGTPTSTPQPGTPTETAVPGTATWTPPAPTATATGPFQSPTPPPPTPTPVGCVDRLADGSFETGGPWVLAGSRPPRAVTDPVHSGERALLLGIRPGEPNVLAYSTTWQRVSVPNGATRLTVSAWTYQQAQSGEGPDRQLLLVYDIDPAQNQSAQRQPIAMVFGERRDVGAWQRRSLTLNVAAYRGQSLWIYATVLNDGQGGRVWMTLDDMEAVFCP